ncbi:MAG: SPOR domain-containing protein, partial [Candidatus Omnitrophica bacterium]|nr:SPOR domain-containing protein [Candidatus Omnitrophota bacterium]
DLGHKTRKDSIVNKIDVDQVSEPRFPTHLCLKAASLIIVAIVSFALGVEHEKIASRNSNYTISNSERKITQISKETPLNKEEAQKPVMAADNSARANSKESSASSEGYIIQVATYKKDSSYIKQETLKLKQKGYVPFFIASGNYMQLCAGKFSSKKIANEHLKKLEQTYKGCYIRKI